MEEKSEKRMMKEKNEKNKGEMKYKGKKKSVVWECMMFEKNDVVEDGEKDWKLLALINTGKSDIYFPEKLF